WLRPPVRNDRVNTFTLDLVTRIPGEGNRTVGEVRTRDHDVIGERLTECCLEVVVECPVYGRVEVLPRVAVGIDVAKARVHGDVRGPAGVPAVPGVLTGVLHPVAVVVGAKEQFFGDAPNQQ